MHHLTLGCGGYVYINDRVVVVPVLVVLLAMMLMGMMTVVVLFQARLLFFFCKCKFSSTIDYRACLRYYYISLKKKKRSLENVHIYEDVHNSLHEE